ncbi:hypothetical protein [Streptomyces sp. CA-106131]|uniref:hypothetical protein n=1 Tax=Streptomyces sp. CA-106131 TaxID=3240045 RepID=UPI003D921089
MMGSTYRVRVITLALITILLSAITRVRCAIEDLLVWLPGRPPARPPGQPFPGDPGPGRDKGHLDH